MSMSGLRNIAKLYGGMKATGSDGKTVHYVWDYAADEPCLASDMPIGSKRWCTSERAKWAKLRAPSLSPKEQKGE